MRVHGGATQYCDADGVVRGVSSGNSSLRIEVSCVLYVTPLISCLAKRVRSRTGTSIAMSVGSTMIIPCIPSEHYVTVGGLRHPVRLAPDWHCHDAI